MDGATVLRAGGWQDFVCVSVRLWYNSFVACGWGDGPLRSHAAEGQSMMTMDEPTVLTPREIAARQRITIDTVKRALRSGGLRGYKVGDRGDWRVTVAEYEAWLARGAPTKPAPEPKE